MIDAEQSTPEQQEAAKAFVNWLVYSDNGQKNVSRRRSSDPGM